MDNQQGPIVWHRELCSMICGSLDGRVVWERMDTRVCMAEFLCCPPEIITLFISYVVMQSPKCVQLFVTPWMAASQASLSLTISWSLPKFKSIVSVMPSSHLILWHSLLLLPLIFSSFRDLSKELAICIRWPKYRSFSISPSNEYPGLISLKIDWFDLLAVHGTLRSLLQHHSVRALMLWYSAFFTG